ncbi:MAG: class I SAM-dependent methyltransferase [Desulfatibacillaceae bacterium]
MSAWRFRGRQEGEAADSLWYKAERLPDLEGPIQKRTVFRRWRFFERIINNKRAENPDEPVRVLDAGCGEGFNLRYLSTAPGVSVFACDMDQERVDRTRQSFPSVQVAQQDLAAPDYEKGFFDIVILSHVLEQVGDDRAVLAAVRDLLSGNGVLILVVPNEGCLLAWIRDTFVDKAASRAKNRVRTYNRRRLRRLFRKAGFSLKRIERENFLFPMPWFHDFFAARKWGFYYMMALNRVLPSQSAGFLVLLERAGRESEIAARLRGIYGRG